MLYTFCLVNEWNFHKRYDHLQIYKHAMHRIILDIVHSKKENWDENASLLKNLCLTISWSSFPFRERFDALGSLVDPVSARSLTLWTRFGIWNWAKRWRIQNTLKSISKNLYYHQESMWKGEQISKHSFELSKVLLLLVKHLTNYDEVLKERLQRHLSSKER